MIRFNSYYFVIMVFVCFQFAGLCSYSAVASAQLERQSEVQEVEDLPDEGRQWSQWLKEGNYELVLEKLEHRQRCRRFKKTRNISNGEKPWFRKVPGEDSNSSQANYEAGEPEVVCPEKVDDVSRYCDENGRTLVQLLVDHYQFEPIKSSSEDFVSLTNGEETRSLPKELYLLMLLHEEGVPFLNQGNIDQDDNVLFAAIAKKYRLLSRLFLMIIHDDLADKEGINGLKSKEGDRLGELLLKKFPDEVDLVGMIESFSLTVDLDRIPDKERGIAFAILSSNRENELKKIDEL